MPDPPGNNPAVARVALWRVNGSSSGASDDLLAVEEPLEIRIGFGPVDARASHVLGLTMRTPGADAELALGYLHNEGIVSSAANVLSCAMLPSGSSVRVELAPDVPFNTQRFERYSFVSSACGVCGRRHINRVERAPAGKSDRRVEASVLHALPEALQASQNAFRSTGGLHAAALCDYDGAILFLREDIGRHNAVDKAVGAALMGGVGLEDKILLVSGRAGYELVQKAIASSIPVLAAIGAPSSLAVELADGFDLTLIGFLREDRFNVYTAGWRLKESDQ